MSEKRRDRKEEESILKDEARGKQKEKSIRRKKIRRKFYRRQ